MGGEEGGRFLRLIGRGGVKPALSFWGHEMILCVFCGFLGALCGMAAAKGLDV